MNPRNDEVIAAQAESPNQSWLQRGFAKLAGFDKKTATLPLVSPVQEIDPSSRMAGFGWALFACAVATGVALSLRGLLVPANLVLLYLMAVVLVAVRFGREAAVLASFVAVLAFDIFLVPPYYSLTVADTEYLFTFAVLLIVALIISHLTANLRHQALIAHSGERRASALFNLSKDLSAALTNAQIAEISSRHLGDMFLARVVLLLPEREGKLAAPAMHPLITGGSAAAILSVAQKAYEEPASTAFSDVPAAAEGMVFLPLRAPMRIRGVLVVLPDQDRPCLAQQEQLLQTCAAQIALAVERVHYVDVAQESMLAMESERLRNSLLSAISHDIRTPLTAIVGLSSALTSGRPLGDETRQELSEAIQENAVRMNNLVTNLLDMARLHSGPVKLNLQWQMLEEVVGSALAMMGPSLAQFRVDVHLPPSLPLLRFDAVLIERVLCNLLDNAAKYAGADGSARLIAEYQDNEVRVSVQDNGPGIPAGMAESIFDKFTRGESESARGGVGLGLSICRTIVEAHGGRIRAENVTDNGADNGTKGGARFVFTLPVGVPPPDDDPELAATAVPEAQ